MTDLNKAKERLLKLKDEYETRINQIKNHVQNPPDDLAEDYEDQAILVRQNDMRSSLLDEAQQNLVHVNDALSRIENGTYGNCNVCRRDIEEKRLEAVPYATLCMEHAS